MSARPLISVITACYNSIEYVDQCMRSVVDQQFPDFEFVVIDGGSTDGTVDAIRSYADKLAYWHSRPDRGIAHAFNLGIEHSRGDWLMFLNSDDYLNDRSALSTLAHEIRNCPDADVVYGMVAFVTREPDPRPAGAAYGEPYRWQQYIRMHSIPHPASLTRRRFMDRVGRFDESYRIAMDYELFLRGGPALSTSFVSRTITCMRLGGASRVDRRRVLDEWHKAIVTHRVLSPIRAGLLYAYFLARMTVAKMLRRPA
jgi:glycosyltransferase involved in cell wall biosynthesis